MGIRIWLGLWRTKKSWSQADVISVSLLDLLGGRHGPHGQTDVGQQRTSNSSRLPIRDHSFADDGWFHSLLQWWEVSLLKQRWETISVLVNTEGHFFFFNYHLYSIQPINLGLICMNLYSYVATTHCPYPWCNSQRAGLSMWSTKQIDDFQWHFKWREAARIKPHTGPMKTVVMDAPWPPFLPPM